MTHLGLREELYLRISSAKTIRHDTTVDVHPDGTLGKVSCSDSGRHEALVQRDVTVAGGPHVWR